MSRKKNQPAAAEDGGKQSLQANTTTLGKGRQEIRDIPQSLTVVTEKLIDDAKLDTLKQALHYTAGITFAATENGTASDHLRGRAFYGTGSWTHRCADGGELLGGLRWDRVRSDMTSVGHANSGTDVSNARTASRLSYPSLWSGRTGLLFQPTASQSYHFSWGTSFNTSADTYQYTTQQIADVPAEKSRNIELGAKLDWLDGRLSTRAALFRTEKYNERTTDSDFAGTYPVLSGRRHSQGLAFDIVGRVTPELEVYVSYAYLHQAVIDKVGSAVTPPNSSGYKTLVGAPVGLLPRHSGAANGFGNHVDNAVRHLRDGGGRVRTDVSCTLFLSEPDEYDGGELTMEDTFGRQRIKLPAGDLIVYPGHSVHRVEPVTRGQRLASYFWVQSLVRSAEQRRLLFDMDSHLMSLRSRLGEADPAVIGLTGTYHNLLRMWLDC